MSWCEPEGVVSVESERMTTVRVLSLVVDDAVLLLRATVDNMVSKRYYGLNERKKEMLKIGWWWWKLAM